MHIAVFISSFVFCVFFFLFMVNLYDFVILISYEYTMYLFDYNDVYCFNYNNKIITLTSYNISMIMKTNQLITSSNNMKILIYKWIKKCIHTEYVQQVHASHLSRTPDIPTLTVHRNTKISWLTVSSIMCLISALDGWSDPASGYTRNLILKVWSLVVVVQHHCTHTDTHKHMSTHI